MKILLGITVTVLATRVLALDITIRGLMEYMKEKDVLPLPKEVGECAKRALLKQFSRKP